MKPLLVGESNPYGANPEFALYPAPRGCSGDRLCRLVLRMDPDAYLDAFERVNLCAGKWSMKAARARAGELLASRAAGVTVLLGARVCNAFGLAFVPFSVVPGGDQVVAILPHPSGLSRAWNEPGAYDRARSVLISAGAIS
jgi:hypothetical protein